MFSSLRLFSVLSLLVMVAVAVAAGLFVRNSAEENLKAMVARNSVNLSQGYINGVWIKYRDVIIPLAAADASALRDNPQVNEFASDTQRFFQHIQLTRVNIYNADGRLLMTSNANGVGKLKAERASPDSAFVTAQFRQNGFSTQYVHGVELDRTPSGVVLQTLLPIRLTTEAQGPEGAVEIIYDVSQAWQQLHDFQLYGTGGILAMFALLLGIMIVTSKKAESIIAKQYEANMELAHTAETAKAENMQKSQFLANISHELRTPLNAIIGFSDIIKNEVMVNVQEKKYHDYIGDIHSSGVHLLSLINDILDYSKAEAGKLEMEVSEVNAGKLIQNSMRLVAPRAEAAKVTLTDALPKEQIILITDSKKFKQILLNLLSNAVKFTPAGGEIRVTAWRDLADDTYSFEVKDTGIGIAPKDISRAMSPFGQVDSALSRKYEGTGLGLPLTKKFVEIMGGKFMIESKVGVGTTITFTLPRELKEREGLTIKQVA